MGLLDRFSRKQQETPEEDLAACTHTRIVPHWDTLQDMGDRGKVTHYECEACHTKLSREEGQALM
ncbi:MAG: hypothetical protein ACE5IZ_02335 [Dehalococcoidia bacterium]